MIRDPRDVIISMLEWIKVMAKSHEADRFLSLSQEKQIKELIEAPDLSMNGGYPFVFDTVLGVKTAITWMQDPSVLVCRFEELVGPQGGGCQWKQKEALKRLAKHLGVFLREEEIQVIAIELFGDTCTFRKGCIGSWKEAFTDEHKALFKQVLGKELITLGYEQDDNW